MRVSDVIVVKFAGPAICRREPWWPAVQLDVGWMRCSVVKSPLSTRTDELTVVQRRLDRRTEPGRCSTNRS